MFETCIKFNNPASDFTIQSEEGNIDGLNFLAGKTMSYVNEKAREGTLLAHTEGGVANLVLEANGITAENIGFMIYFFEKTCAVSGYMLGVNPFNQPGVESYKKICLLCSVNPAMKAKKKGLKRARLMILYS